MRGIMYSVHRISTKKLCGQIDHTDMKAHNVARTLDVTGFQGTHPGNQRDLPQGTHPEEPLRQCSALSGAPLLYTGTQLATPEKTRLTRGGIACQVLPLNYSPSGKVSPESAVVSTAREGQDKNEGPE